MDRFLPRLQKVQGKSIVTQITTSHNRQQIALRITDGQILTHKIIFVTVDTKMPKLVLWKGELYDAPWQV
jgi:hypothetical protein